MALTDSSRIFVTETRDIERILAYCKEYFEQRDYNVTVETTIDGGFISLTKGGIFKTISGMKTGLNMKISQMPGAISVSMEIGLFGKQLIPSAIAMLVFWPILIPQIYGLVQQNKLDKEAYEVVEAAIHECEKVVESIPEHTAFCVYCGAAMPADAAFCTSCGKRIIVENTTCEACGAELTGDFAFCPKCGAKVG